MSLLRPLNSEETAYVRGLATTFAVVGGMLIVSQMPPSVRTGVAVAAVLGAVFLFGRCKAARRSATQHAALARAHQQGSLQGLLDSPARRRSLPRFADLLDHQPQPASHLPVVLD